MGKSLLLLAVVVLMAGWGFNSSIEREELRAKGEFAMLRHAPGGDIASTLKRDLLVRPGSVSDEEWLKRVGVRDMKELETYVHEAYLREAREMKATRKKELGKRATRA